MASTLNQWTGVEGWDAFLHHYEPKQVILFGSRARGNSGNDSDVDLCIVQDRERWICKSRREETARIRRIFAHSPIAMDLVLLTDKEALSWAQEPPHDLARALNEGVTLYYRLGDR